MSRRSEHTTKVFVGSLPPNVTADDLRGLFAPYGEIAECDIANRCGFLHLEDKDLAEKAIEELNNTTFMGGRISVEKGRVKPRGERRMRNPGGGRGGGLGARKRDVGPYARDGSYGRGGPPRNGNYGRDEYNNYSEYRGEYGRGYEEGGYDRRPMYDERRGGGYMNERRPYNNGYERRPYDDRAPYGDVQRPGYDERRMPPAGPAAYDERRPPMNDRRPLIDDQGMGQNAMARPPMNNYERAPPSNDMFSRRDSTPKPMTGGYDRSTPTNYGTGYGAQASTGYGATPTTGYGAPPSTGYTQQPATGYGDTRGQNAGYMDNRQQAAPAAQTYGTNQGYSTTQSGGYGDNYGVRAPTNTYDTAYPPLPQQRGFAGGNTSGPHRDMPPARRY